LFSSFSHAFLPAHSFFFMLYPHRVAMGFHFFRNNVSVFLDLHCASALFFFTAEKLTKKKNAQL